MGPVLSIITPSYEQGAFIEDNIRSVCQADVPDLEHIVVDGGSSDETVAILEAHEDEYDLRWVSEPDRGQVHAINKGVRMASGDWIGWQNSDDYYTDQGLLAVYRRVTDDPDLELVYGDLQFVDEAGNPIGSRRHGPASTFIQRHLQHFTANHTTFVRDSLAEQIYPLSEDYNYAMDVEWFWKLLNSDPTSAHLPEWIACHRVHDAAKTNASRTKQIQQENAIQQRLDEPFAIETLLPDRLLTYLAYTYLRYHRVRER
jgi:glycosyltransferase involved in cell wall biosynthesis